MTVGVGAVSDPVAGCGLKDPIRWIWAAVTGVTAHVSCVGTMTAVLTNCAPGCEAETRSINPILESAAVPVLWPSPASVGTVNEYFRRRVHHRTGT